MSRRWRRAQRADEEMQNSRPFLVWSREKLSEARVLGYLFLREERERKREMMTRTLGYRSWGRCKATRKLDGTLLPG